MQVFVTSEERFARTPEGYVWSRGGGSYAFWKRYLDVFEHVRVIGRICNSGTVSGPWMRADGKHVTFDALPCYLGPLQYALKYLAIRATIRNALTKSDAVIMRVPSPVADCLERQLVPGRTFGLEVIGDPHEVFAPGSSKHPMRTFLRWFSTYQLRRLCQQASAVAYVSTSTLPRYYPPGQCSFFTSYSSIELDDVAFVSNPRTYGEITRPIRIISVGTFEALYKGFDTLLDAVCACVKTGGRLQLTIVGDGRYRSQLEQRAKACGISSQVTFLGQIPAGEGVRNQLDRADLFVLASKTEGLPRAMIEAMARGLPCIGTAVGGIPELLAPEELVPRGDAAALAQKIAEIVRDPDRMTKISAANLARARNYHTNVLTRSRRQFFDHVQEITQRWNGRNRFVIGPSEARVGAALPSHSSLIKVGKSGTSRDEQQA